MPNIQNINNVYGIDPITDWIYIQPDKITDQDQANKIASQLISDACIQRVKTIGYIGIATCGTFGIVLYSFIVFKVSSLFISALASPIAAAPLLHGLVTYLGGLGLGACFLYSMITSYILFLLKKASENWAYANHLYKQAQVAKSYAQIQTLSK